MKIMLEEICQFLKETNKINLLTHKSPDGDTLGSSFALKYALEKLGKKVYIYCNDPLPKKFEYMGKLDPLESLNQENILVGIDLADTTLLGDKLQSIKNNIHLSIDHHISNSLYAKKSFIVENASATAEIIYDIIRKLEINIDSQIASCIYTGISTDTGCFKYSNTTAKAHMIAAKMFELGCDFKSINKKMFETKTQNQIKIEKFILDTLETYLNGSCAIIQIPYKLKTSLNAKDEELDSFSGIPLTIEGVLVGVTLKEKEPEKIKVSIRTDGKINASHICKEFGGGGHLAAAGCLINASLDEAREQILKVVKKELEKINL